MFKTHQHKVIPIELEEIIQILSQLKIIRPQILIIKGLPSNICHKGILAQSSMFGQFGIIRAISFAERPYGILAGIEYENPISVALAIYTLNGIEY